MHLSIVNNVILKHFYTLVTFSRAGYDTPLVKLKVANPREENLVKI